MMPVTKPGKLIMPEVHSNGSQDSLDKASPNSLDSGSPHRSWQDTLDQLSIGLQRICKSPVRDTVGTPPLNGSPSLQRSASPLVIQDTDKSNPGNAPIVHQNGGVLRRIHEREDASQKRASEHMNFYSYHCPTVLIHDLSEDHLVLRVRHEESTRLLQRQLARISGYQSEEEVSLSSRSHTTKDLAAKVTKRRASSVSRFRKSLPLVDCNHGQLLVEYKDSELCVVKVAKEGMLALHTVKVPKSLSLQRLMCTLHEDTLMIAEYPKKVVYVESSYASFFDNYYCPVVAEDVKNDTWKLVWHVPPEFEAKHVIVKTVDDKLEVHCRQGRSSSSELIPGSPDVANSATVKQLMIRIELPENVDPKTVSAIISYGTNQLIIQGISAWRSRCVTY